MNQETGDIAGTPPEDLRIGLRRVRDLRAGMKKTLVEIPTFSEEDRSRMKEQALQLKAEWSKLRPRVLEDPATYFAFVRAPENEFVFGELLSLLPKDSFYDGMGVTYRANLDFLG
jgi:hypothetical protein